MTIMNNQTLVKICGIRDVSTAVATAEAGADFIGLVFHSGSKRNVDREKAREIVSAIKQHKTKAVGVFVEQGAEEIAEICQYAGINIAQLHGDSARNAASALPDNIIKIFAVNVGYDVVITDVKKLNAQHPTLDWRRDYLLFDGVNSGSGQPFNLDGFKPDRSFRFFLSGGLTPENVCKAIAAVAPFAVDVSSGVEREKGVKDMELVKKFINSVKGI